MSVEQDNRQLVTEFMEAFGTADIEKTLSYMGEDATWTVMGDLPGLSGTHSREAFGELLGGLAPATRTGAIRLTPHEWTCQGERVAVETESYSELNNGRVYNNRYHFLFVVRDGRIRAVKEYLDTEHTRAIFLAE
jgi:hypothetical protein